MRTKTRWLAIILIATVIAAQGCAASFVNKSAAAIGAAANTYDIGMQVVADLQAQGVITDEQRGEINKIGTIVYNAVIVADKALIAYNNALIQYNEDKTDENKAELAATKAALKASVDFVSSAWGDFANIVNTFRPNTLPERI